MKKKKPEFQKPVKRWALWSPIFGFFLPQPNMTEMLFESRAAAIAKRLSGSYYNYHPVRVELRPLQVLKFKG